MRGAGSLESALAAIGTGSSWVGHSPATLLEIKMMAAVFVLGSGGADGADRF